MEVPQLLTNGWNPEILSREIREIIFGAMLLALISRPFDQWGRRTLLATVGLARGVALKEHTDEFKFIGAYSCSKLIDAIFGSSIDPSRIIGSGSERFNLMETRSQMIDLLKSLGTQQVSATVKSAVNHFSDWRSGDFDFAEFRANEQL